MVLLARGLDRLQVSLCPHSLGRELYDNLKLTADMSKPALRNLRFPINMLNRIAYGISLGSWGARAHNCAPKHYLTTADFAKVSQDAFDNFAPKKDNALEAPPRLITSMLVWHQYTVHQITVFGLVYGREHEAERKQKYTMCLVLRSDLLVGAPILLNELDHTKIWFAEHCCLNDANDESTQV